MSKKKMRSLPPDVETFIAACSQFGDDPEQGERITNNLTTFANAAMKDGLFDVGYGKPPVEHRFQKGNPGGPGRPKIPPLERVLKAQLKADNERALKRLVRQLLKNALKGDQRALNAIIRISA
ncbi:MAG: DUF5681 domain-containing protein [Fimbriimonadaceae bacterium]